MVKPRREGIWSGALKVFKLYLLLELERDQAAGLPPTSCIRQKAFTYCSHKQASIRVDTMEGNLAREGRVSAGLGGL